MENTRSSGTPIYEKYVSNLLDGRYRIEKVLGTGGMAVVFRAHDEKEDRMVAIKMLRDDIAGDPEAVARFVNESRAVSMLSHPNIVAIHDVSVETVHKYLVMEYIDGVSLRAYMDKRGALPAKEIISYTEQILSALVHAHSKGVVHRDIKPQNIMVTEKGEVKVMDFGIARFAMSQSRTIDGNAIGSVICNAALIAAITIAVRPGKVDPKSLRTPVAFFFVAAAFYAGVAYTTGSFTRPVGLILLAMFVAYIVCNVLAMKNTPAPEEEEQAEEGPFAKELGLLVIGAVLIAVGADLLVDNGTLIAQALGVPESVIALTFVALGTSLPELVTAITSLAKGHGALSLGNVIGANVFNLVLVSGVSVTLAPFSIPQNSTIAGMNASLVMDIPVMFAVMLLLTLPALIKGKLSRPQGIALLCIYAAFCAVQFSI